MGSNLWAGSKIGVPIDKTCRLYTLLLGYDSLHLTPSVSTSCCTLICSNELPDWQPAELTGTFFRFVKKQLLLDGVFAVAIIKIIINSGGSRKWWYVIIPPLLYSLSLIAVRGFGERC